MGMGGPSPYEGMRHSNLSTASDDMRKEVLPGTVSRRFWGV